MPVSKPKACPDCGAAGIMAADICGTWSCYCYACRATWTEKPDRMRAYSSGRTDDGGTGLVHSYAPLHKVEDAQE